MTTQRPIGRIALIVLALLAGITPLASAQHIINLSAGGADQTYSGAADARAGFSLDQGAVGGNDGRRDLIIGAPGGATGRVYIMFGGPARHTASLESEAEAIVTGPASFGFATAAGNVTNADGASPRNLIVGAPDANGGRGAVYVFTNNFTSGQRSTQALAPIVITGAAGDRLGSSLGTADLDNDGYRELIMGAPGGDRIYILYGGPTLASRDLTSGADTVIVGHPSNNSGIGLSLAAGPITGDSIYDLLIGEPAANSVYMIAGRSARLPLRIDLPAGGTVPSPLPDGVTAMYVGPDAGDEAGAMVRVADLDGNGALDVLVGAPGGDGRNNTAPNAGEVYVLWNEQTATSGSLRNAGAVFHGGQNSQRLGEVFATGDINRDTPNDIIFRMHYGTGGEVRVYYGRNRSSIGPLVDGRRIVDFAVPNSENRIIINDATTTLLTALSVFEVTGEGARDIVIADAAAGNNAGKVFLAISPKLRTSVSSVSATLAEGATLTRAVAVQNESPISVSWSAVARTGAPWLAVVPAEGTSNSATSTPFELRMNTAGLAPGTYTATVDVDSTSIDLRITRTVNVSMTVSESRFLTIESPSNNASLTPPFVVTGWAIDTASATGTGVSRVDIYAVPLSGTGRTLLGTATYGSARPSVGTTYGSRFANSGFSLTVNRAPGGTYKIVADAYSTATPSIWNKPATAPTVTVAGSPSRQDFNGDGFTDLVWQNLGTRGLVFWSMDGYTMRAGGALAGGQLPAGRWEVRAVADMNGDTHPDLILQELGTGHIEAWLLNRTTLLERRSIDRMSDTNWRVVAAPDFNNDGHADLLFQHYGSGHLAAWLMNRTTLSEGRLLNPGQVSDLDWKIVGTADVNNDGMEDIVWQNRSSRVVTSWLMNGTNFVGAGPFSLTRSSGDWDMRVVADINGDGSADMLWQDFTRGLVAAWLLNGQTFVDAALLNPSSINSWQLGGSR